MRDMSLRQLLEQCAQPTHRDWEKAWRCFMERYGDYIYYKIKRRCLSWNAPALDRQIDESAQDILANVFETLTKNRCKALQNFQAKDEEGRFKVYLATIISRTASAYIQKHFPRERIEEEFANLAKFLRQREFEEAWAVYEEMVQFFRSQAKKRNRSNLERDINLFQFYTFGDFSNSMVRTHPCMMNMTPGAVDDVMLRLRKTIREDKKFCAKLREMLI